MQSGSLSDQLKIGLANTVETDQNQPKDHLVQNSLKKIDSNEQIGSISDQPKRSD